MTLATRCAACGTTFRVVQDQLRVSEGWVRCGQCGDVFDAQKSLIELQGAPTAGDGPAVFDAAKLDADKPDADMPDADMPDADTADADVAAVLEPDPAPEPPAPPPVAEADAPLMDADTASAPQAGDDTLTLSDSARALLQAKAIEHGSQAAAPLDAMAEGPPASANSASKADRSASRRHRSVHRPNFIRQAERAARWDQPHVQAGLATVCSVLFLGLLMQLALQFHDTVANRWPATRTALDGLCRQVGCLVDSRRQLGSLVVESAALTVMASEGIATHQLALAVRNQSTQPVALPAFDLTLTSAGGEIVARRVIMPAQIDIPGLAIAPSSEWTAQIPLQLADPRVSGFSVEIFYP